MKKYFAIARAELLDALQEKGEILIWILIEAIPVFVMGSLWKANQAGLIALNVSQLVTYYVIVLVIARVTEYWFDEYLQDEIRDGTFSRYLLFPISVPLVFIPFTLGRKIYSTILLLPIFLITLFIFRQNILYPTGISFLLFLVSIIIASVIRYSLSVVVSTGAFYWEQAHALLHARWLLEVMVGGYLLPLSLYPKWLQSVANLLPFKYLFYIPASIYTSAISPMQAVSAISQATVWMIILLIVSHRIWVRGVRKYSSVGG